MLTDLNLRMNLRLGTQLWRNSAGQNHVLCPRMRLQAKRRRNTPSPQSLRSSGKMSICEVESILKHLEVVRIELNWNSAQSTFSTTFGIQQLLILRSLRILCQQDQLSSLMDIVDLTEPHFIRAGLKLASNLQIFFFWSVFFLRAWFEVLTWSWTVKTSSLSWPFGQVLLLPFRVRFCRYCFT